MPTNVALTGLAKDLAARGDTGKPIRIGLVGASEMWTDVVSRVAQMQGILIGAICWQIPTHLFKATHTTCGSRRSGCIM